MRSRQIRQTQKPPQPDPGAWEHMANLAHESQAAAENILDEFAKVVPPAVFESIAARFGWTSCCQGTGLILAHPVDERGDVPCGRCS